MDTNAKARYTLYNEVGTDGSWFSPFGWRVRALLSLKGINVTEVDMPFSQLKSVLEQFSGTSSTPCLIDYHDMDENGEPKVSQDSMDICVQLDEVFRGSDASIFPPDCAAEIEAFEESFHHDFQVPAFATFGSMYLSNGVISGEDDPVFRSFILRATGASVEENENNHEHLLAKFRASLKLLAKQLEGKDWLLGSAFTYNDLLLLGCLKCMATVMRGLDAVLGSSEADGEMANLHVWYANIHKHCNIKDPY
jgi:glutathione S-transferase